MTVASKHRPAPLTEPEIEFHLTAADAALAAAGHTASPEAHDAARRVGRGELTVGEAIVMEQQRILGSL